MEKFISARTHRATTCLFAYVYVCLYMYAIKIKIKIKTVRARADLFFDAGPYFHGNVVLGPFFHRKKWSGGLKFSVRRTHFTRTNFPVTVLVDFIMYTIAVYCKGSGKSKKTFQSFQPLCQLFHWMHGSEG